MNRQRYFTPNYFSISEILASKERVPCTTNVSFPKMGFLFPENGDEDLKEGTSINIPVWLAKGLAGRHIKYVKVGVPNCFDEKARDVLEADPKVVNLYRLNPYFFEFASAFISLGQKENDTLLILLKKVFFIRLMKILNWSIHGMKDPLQIQELDLFEQRILKESQNSVEKIEEWFLKPELQLKPADSVVNLKKRKLLEVVSNSKSSRQAH